MSVRTDVINLNVNINGDASKAKLNELRKSAADIKFEMQGLKKGTEEYIAKNKELASVKNQMDELKKSIGVSALSLKELNSEATKLKSMRDSVTQGTEAWIKYDAQLKEVQAQQAKVKTASDGIGNSLKNANDHGSSFGKVFTHVAEAAASWFAIEAVLEKVKEFFKGSVEEAMKYEESMSRLHNILDNLGRADVFDRLKEKAEALANQFKYLHAPDVVEVFQKLITYGKLTENQITDLTSVIINFAAKQRITLTEATDVMTKALEGNSKELKKYGVNVKDGADVTERFSILMNDLKPRVEGAADAFGKTFAGQLAIARKELAETEEEIGGKMIPVLTALLRTVSMAMKGVGESFQFLSDASTMGLKAAFTMQKARDVMDSIKKSEEQQVDNLVKMYDGKNANGKMRTADEKIKMLAKDREFDEEQLRLAEAAQDTAKYKMYKKNIDQINAAIEKLAQAGDGNEILGFGDDSKKKDKGNKIEELRKKFEELMDKVHETLGKDTMSPLEAGFIKINDEMRKQLELIDELQKKHAISAKEAKSAQKDIHEAAAAASNELYQKITDAIAKKRGSTGTIIEPSDIINEEAFDKQMQKILAHAKSAVPGMSKDRIAGAQLDVNHDEKGSKQWLNDQLRLLNLQEDQELQNTELTENEKQLIREKYNQKRLDADDAVIDKEAAKASELVSKATSVNNILMNLENARMNRVLRNNELEKQGMQKAVTSKLMSQEQYNAAVTKMDNDADKQKRRLARDQAKREQAISLSQAVINGYVAVSKAATALPWPFNLPGIIAETVRSGLLIAGIASQPLPELGTGGWMQDGQTHAQGGVNANIEKNEAVMKASAMTDNNQYTVSGTPAQITSALNSNAGGVSWAAGATMQPAWRTARPQQLNPSMPRIMALGGYNAATQSASGGSDASAAILQQLLQKHTELGDKIESWQGRIHTVYSASDVKNRTIVDNYYNAAKNASKLSQ